MERSEAAEILEEIIESCAGLDGHYLALMPPNPNSKLSLSYQVIVKMNLIGQERKCIEDMLIQHGLVWHESEGETVIYRKAS